MSEELYQENERIYLERAVKPSDPVASYWAGDWEEWSGAKKFEERPSGIVDVVLRGGATMVNTPAYKLNWKHIGRSGDIVRWRQVLEGSPRFPDDPAREILAEEPQKPAEKESALDVQVGGDHYKDNAIQPTLYIMANNIPFVEGNVIKYVSRWRKKGGVSDLKKARHYLDMLIEFEEKDRG